jgi:ParB family transcriptional regulator, chromosome partitioning protein
MSRKSTIDSLFMAKLKPSVGTGNLADDRVLGAPNTVSSPALPGSPIPPVEAGEPRMAVRTGAVAAIGNSLQQWGQVARNAELLQSQLADARTLVELDPASIDPAPVRDRLAMEDDPTFESLKVSIRSGGQQVPVLVRPHPTISGRYQAAYGHRRLRAARELGIRIKAIISSLDDEALVLAQGQENSERRDLSFIERALFALRLEGAGQPRPVIGNALGIDKGDLSRFISVARSVPEDIIRLIGPAPKVGRSRWMALAEHFALPAALIRAEAVTATPEFANAGTEQRFALVLAAAEQRHPISKKTVSGRDGNTASTIVLKDAIGQTLVSIEDGPVISRIVIDSQRVPDFAAHLASQLPRIFDEWRQQRGGGQGAVSLTKGPRIRS